MNVIALIAVLEAKGMSAADIIDVVKAVADGGGSRSSGALRTAKWRAKKAGDVTCDVTCDKSSPERPSTFLSEPLEFNQNLSSPPIVPPPRKPRSSAGDGEKSLLDSGVKAETLEAWKGVRKAKRAGPISVIAAAGLLREAIKARISADDAVRIAVERGWQTFKADWAQGNARAGPALGEPRRGAAGLVDALRELENEERSDDQRKPDGALFLLPGC